MTRASFVSALLACTASLVACGGSDDPDGNADETTTGSTDGSEADGDTGESTSSDDTGETTGDTGDEGDTTDEGETGADTSVCDELGLEAREFSSEGGTAWGDVAGDFTLETTFGTWSFSESYTGCDTVVIIHDLQDTASSQLFFSAASELFSRSAMNVQYVFVNDAADPAARAEEWQNQIGAAIGGLSDQAMVDWWAERVHFVTTSPTAIEGSLGEFLGVHGGTTFAIGIDREQRWDDIGSVSDFTGSFSPSLPVIGYTSRYYNFRYDQTQALAAQQDVTEVVIMDQVEFSPDCVVGEGCFDTQNGPFSNSNNNSVWTASFPDAATMAGFDTMELVVTARCGPDNYSDCGHWDYEAMIDLCADAECASLVGEFARWITPYSRPGERQWVFDATPMLGLVSDGGDQHFRFSMIWNMNPSVWDMRVRLRNQGGSRNVQTDSAYRANAGFNDTYNANFEPFSFTPPADATRVELVAIISGHGQATNNCSEWCEHQHEFTVNGSDVYLREFPGDVGGKRCAEAVDEGVVPGQYGNWTPGRAGWCPGQPVQPWRVDITDAVTPGQENTLTYRGLFGGQPPSAGDNGRIRLSVYVASYAD